jgi:hypothetical protein
MYVDKVYLYFKVTYKKNMSIHKPVFEPPSRNIFVHQPDKGSPSKPHRSISPINSNKIQNLQK